MSINEMFNAQCLMVVPYNHENLSYRRNQVMDSCQ